MVEITSRTTGKLPSPALPKAVEPPLVNPGVRWCAGIVAATVVVLVAAWALNPTAHRTIPAAESRELPVDLTGRCEAMGRAWITRDFITMHRLTASERQMELRAWLARHPSPLSDKDAANAVCEVRILNERPATAQIAIRIETASGARSEVRQNWVKEEDRWVFMPPDGRVALVGHPLSAPSSRTSDH